MIYRIEAYVAGKRGSVEPERVIAVTPDEVRSFLPHPLPGGIAAAETVPSAAG